MRVNIYAEEMTNKVEIISKEIDGHVFTGLRFYLELPATVDGKQYQGPFMHRPGDDDSSAVTFWGKRDLRKLLKQASEMLDDHYTLLGTQKAKPTRMCGKQGCKNKATESVLGSLKYYACKDHLDEITELVNWE